MFDRPQRNPACFGKDGGFFSGISNSLFQKFSLNSGFVFNGKANLKFRVCPAFG